MEILKGLHIVLGRPMGPVEAQVSRLVIIEVRNDALAISLALEPHIARAIGEA